jgi:DNA invertase Pin-like site-specific DNA recombinase
MKAFSYLRVSSRSQIDGDGFDRQRDKIQKWAKTNGATIEREFREEGISGANELEGRPAMIELLGAIAANGVRTVIVERADRFARDLVASELLLREFTRLGVKVIEAEGGNDLSAGDDNNPTAKLVRQILGAVSEFDKTSIVLKLKAARVRAKREKGRCEGRKPYGERKGEAEILEMIRSLRRKPKGGKRLAFAAIAEKLNHCGISSRSGKTWHPEVIRRLLGAKRSNQVCKSSIDRQG